MGAGVFSMADGKATFAAGCFWHVQAEFDKVPGVTRTTCGYTGGHTDSPTYKEVCTDKTGHAESVLVEYDPKKTSYAKLLAAFFEMHDPTTVNRQGPDVGTQYRSAIFYHDAKQKQEAEKMAGELAKSGRFKKPIVTQIAKAGEFWKAEEYHQKYYEKTGFSQTCKLP